jgi:GntR family transcriptional repressor for pyruvate dehydrogenase complex
MILLQSISATREGILMALKEIKAPTRKQLFIDELQQMILSGELKAGDRLPSQRELAHETKVSLSVVNAGITNLAARGFVRIEPRQGVYVANIARDGNIQTLVSLLDYTSTALDTSLLEPIIGFRKALEPQIVRGACEHATQDELDRIDTIVDAMAEADEETMPGLSFDFHHEVAIASGNMVYSMLVNTFKDIYVSFFRATQAYYGPTRSLPFFRHMADLIRRRDAEGAVAAQMDEFSTWLESMPKKEKER